MKLCVEGWRGINHSYAMVNQYQLLELLRRPGIALSHRDLPFAQESWSQNANPPGFDDASAHALGAIAPPDGQQDIIYRIAYPYRAHADAHARIFCQATCEYRRMIDAAPFVTPADGAVIDPETRFITPSQWAKQGLAASGLAAERIHVVPHGVDSGIFHPPTPQAREETRGRYRIGPERFVFLNIGGMGFNKGIDLLLVAFAEVRRRHPHVLLLLKDQRSLYPWNAGAAFQETKAAWPGKLDDLTRDHLSVIGTDLDLAGLAALYGACDAYVSPYRAEGFNIPPLEAASCGLPIAVTAGGATDDYAHDSFALRLPSRDASSHGMDYLQADLDGLIEAMLALVERRTPAIDSGIARAWIAQNLTWKHTVDKLLAAFAA